MVCPDKQEKIYFFLCLFLRKRFLRLCVAILCLFLFFPLGMFEVFLNEQTLLNLVFHVKHESLGRFKRGDKVCGNNNCGIL